MSSYPDPYQTGAPSPSLYPAPSGSNGRTLSIVAIVLSGLALVIAIGTAVALLASGLWWFGGSYEDEYLGGDEAYGTAPQVVAGQTYSGETLASEVATSLEFSGYLVEGLSCADVTEVTGGAESLCSGEVDDEPSTVTVRFEDPVGHFTVSVG